MEGSWSCWISYQIFVTYLPFFLPHCYVKILSAFRQRKNSSLTFYRCLIQFAAPASIFLTTVEREPASYVHPWTIFLTTVGWILPWKRTEYCAALKMANYQSLDCCCLVPWYHGELSRGPPTPTGLLDHYRHNISSTSTNKTQNQKRSEQETSSI